MRKATKYDWKDTNLPLIGSDVEKPDVEKPDAAKNEPAWTSSGKKVGLEIWRVVKFEIEEWLKEDHGKFYSGDSYIVLNTYKNKDDLEYDIHFWIGKYSTQDEYGTAAYKTVELDTFHNDKPVQHREIQGNESPLFRTYFPKGIELLKGGSESGFRRVIPTEYKPRLLRIKGTTDSNIVIKEVGLYKQSLNKEDVFVLDKGVEIIQINTPNCDEDEKVKAVHYCLKLKQERCTQTTTSTVDDEPLADERISSVLGDKNKKNKAPAPAPQTHTKSLLKVSADSGTIDMELVAEGTPDLEQDLLDPNDVFIVDLEKMIYVWIGDSASSEEKKNGMSYAHSYLSKSDCPFRSISVVTQRRAEFCYKEMKQ